MSNPYPFTWKNFFLKSNLNLPHLNVNLKPINVCLCQNILFPYSSYQPSFAGYQPAHGTEVENILQLCLDGILLIWFECHGHVSDLLGTVWRARLLLCCFHSKCLADDSTSSVLSTQEAARGECWVLMGFRHHYAVMYSIVHRRDFCMLYACCMHAVCMHMCVGYFSWPNYFRVPLKCSVFWKARDQPL